MVDLQGQIQVLASMFGTGIGLAAVFEIYRQCHKVYRFKKILLHFLDFVFWVMAALATFAVLFINAEGELRLYSLLFLALGATFHNLFVRSVTIKMTNIAISVVTVVFNTCRWIFVQCIYKPLLLLRNIIKIVWKLLLRGWNLVLFPITALVGTIEGMLHYSSHRWKKLFKKKR